MSGKPLGNRQRADHAARLETYKTARDEGLGTWDAAARTGISEHTRQSYERWYRRLTGQPQRESRMPGAAQTACEPEWRVPS